MTKRCDGPDQDLALQPAGAWRDAAGQPETGVMKVLLTGFEPFGGSQVNPSAQVVHTLMQGWCPWRDVASRPFCPVDRQGGPATLLNAVRACQPDAILCLGEAARRPAISIERVALNLLDYRMADNSGHQAVDEPVVPDGPSGLLL